MKLTALVALSALLFLASLELGLRLLPQAIPLEALVRFEPELRSQIAERRQLQRKADTVTLPRDDGGPEDRFWAYRPGTRVVKAFDEPGIVETVVTDEQGFCNAPPDAHRAAHFDVIAVGDSFTWCSSVDPADTWPARLQARTGLRTYNLGLPGRGLHEYVQALKLYGLPKSPKVVVMAVYEGNDLRDAYFFHRGLVAPESSLEAFACPFDFGWLCRADVSLRAGPAGRSYSYGLLSGGARHLAERAQKREVDFRYDLVFADGQVVEFNSRNGDRDEVLFARRLRSGDLSPELFEDALESFLGLSRQQGFVPVVTYIPSAYTAYEAKSRFEAPGIEADLRAYSRMLRDWFAEHARRHGYAFADLTPALQAAAASLPASELLYFRTQVHLTQRGHDLVAREVARAIQALHLPRPAS